MEKMPRVVWAAVCIALPFGFAALLYPGLPERVPTHFGPDGRPDAWGGRGSIFLGPTVMAFVSAFVYALLTNLGRIDPKRRSAADEAVMRDFALFLSGFLSGLTLCILAATAWPALPVVRLLLGYLGLGFAGIGLYLPRLGPNYFAGFRLPWTLEDAANWASTHRVAGRLWLWGGLCLGLAALLLEGPWLWGAFSVALAAMTLVPVLHSWRRFRGRA